MYLTSSHLEVPIPLADRLVIGRHEKLCDLAFPGDESISRRHCFIMRAGNGYLVRDLESRNGVFVNGIEVSGQHPLELGDQIRVGHVVEFQLVDSVPEPVHKVAAKPAPKKEVPAATLRRRERQRQRKLRDEEPEDGLDVLASAAQLERKSRGKKVHKLECDECEYTFSCVAPKQRQFVKCPQCSNKISLSGEKPRKRSDEPIKFDSEWDAVDSGLRGLHKIGMGAMFLATMHFIIISVMGAAFYGRTAFSVFIPFEEGGAALPEGQLLLVGTAAVLFVMVPFVVLFAVLRLAEEFSALIRLAAGVGVIPGIILWQACPGATMVRIGFVIYAIPIAISVVPMIQLWRAPRRLRHLTGPLIAGTMAFAAAAVGVLVALALAPSGGKTTAFIGVPGLATAAIIGVAVWGAGQVLFCVYLSGAAKAIKEAKVGETIDNYLFLTLGGLAACAILLLMIATQLATGIGADLGWLVAVSLAALGIISFYQLASFLNDCIR